MNRVTWSSATLKRRRNRAINGPHDVVRKSPELCAVEVMQQLGHSSHTWPNPSWMEESRGPMQLAQNCSVHQEALSYVPWCKNEHKKISRTEEWTAMADPGDVDITTIRAAKPLQLLLFQSQLKKDT